MASSGDKATLEERQAKAQDLSKICESLVLENIRRNREIFEGFNPVTGRGAPGPRVKVVLPDSPIRVQHMPERVARHNIIVKKLIKHGSIKKYITDEMGWRLCPSAIG